MDTTIRNLDEDAYRAFKARAALTGTTIGQLLNEAMRAYLARSEGLRPRGSLADLVPEPYPQGTEYLSEHVDAVVYGE